MADKMKVLIVDDSVVFRNAVAEALKSDSSIEVIGSVRNGVKAIEFLESKTPDIITLDVEMPEMDGIETLKAINKLNESRADARDIGVVMLSAHTKKGANTTIKALEYGAFDFITKPEGSDIRENIEALKRQLLVKLRVFGVRHSRNGKKLSPPPKKPAKKPSLPVASTIKVPRGKIEAIVIGVSTGGPKALATILPSLTQKTNLPIFIVQHMPPSFTKSLADSLDRKCDSTVIEASDSDTVQNSYVYIAPGGKHLVLKKNGHGETHTAINNDEPEHSCRPSVNKLFRSVADTYGGKVIAVILTGMGTDGTDGLEPLKKKGAYVIAQDEATSVVWGMPGSAVSKDLVDEISPLNNVPDAIMSALS